MHEPASTALAGKVAFITGAAGGLGQAMSRAFAAHGASVALADLSERADWGEDQRGIKLVGWLLV